MPDKSKSPGYIDPDPDSDDQRDISRAVNEAVLIDVHSQVQDVLGSKERDQHGEELLEQARQQVNS